MTDDIQAIVDAAAEKAAQKTAAKVMTAMGVNINDPQSVEDLRTHMDHLRSQYEACQVVRPYMRHTLKTAIGVVVTAIAAYMLMQFGLPKP